jgi:hypothetical protein
VLQFTAYIHVGNYNEKTTLEVSTCRRSNTLGERGRILGRKSTHSLDKKGKKKGAKKNCR